MAARRFAHVVEVAGASGSGSPLLLLDPQHTVTGVGLHPLAIEEVRERRRQARDACLAEWGPISRGVARTRYALASGRIMTDVAFGMLERSRRPLGDEDRALIEQRRHNDLGTTRFDAKFTFFIGAAGLVLGYVWQPVFRWPTVALTLAGAVIGFLVDYRRFKRERDTREAATAAKWNPVIAVGVVEHVVAEASSAVRIDDSDGNTAWFLQADERQILCVWDWAEHATDHVKIDLVPGDAPATVAVVWSGKKLKPLRPTRTFKSGEREPEQCEVLDGTLQELDSLLRAGGTR